MYKDRLTIEGERILKRIFQRDKTEGGVSLETVGPQGSGKTSADLHFLERIRDKHPEEILFYRDSVESPVQFNRVDKWRIYAEEGTTLKFRDYTTNSYFDVSVTPFCDFEDLYNKAEPYVLNVIYFKKEYTWIDYLNYLRRHMHRGNGWKSVFLEEYEDITPQYAGGKQWIKNLLYSKNAKNIRKGLVSTFANTQAKSDVSYFIRNKLMMRSYLNGSKVDDTSPIEQRAVDKLHIGEAMIDFGSRFGKFTHKAFPPTKKIFEVEKIVIVDEKEVEEELKDKKLRGLEKKISRLEEILDKLDVT
jgi:hypothetical protein